MMARGRTQGKRSERSKASIDFRKDSDRQREGVFENLSFIFSSYLSLEISRVKVYTHSSIHELIRKSLELDLTRERHLSLSISPFLQSEDPTGTSNSIIGNAIGNFGANCMRGVYSDGTWSETPNYWYFGTNAHARAGEFLNSKRGFLSSSISCFDLAKSLTSFPSFPSLLQSLL